MFEINIKVSGTRRAIAGMRKELDKREKRCLEILEEWAEALALEAKRRAPVDTGYLRDSITYRIDDNLAIIVAEADYAIYVEQGARGRAGVHFMSGATLATRRRFVKLIEAAWHGTE